MDMTNPKRIYYEDGNIKHKAWYLNDQIHRADGPASIQYYENGNIHREAWLLNGQRHRTDGPAVIRYYKDGNIKHKAWFLNGQKFDPTDWLYENNITAPYTDEDKMAIKLRWT